MTTEEIVAATALNSWKILIGRADKFFSTLTDEQLQAEVAPGKNRLVYLWGHLIAVHDRMSPLFGIGEPLHPELDAPFLTEADNRSAESPSAADLKRSWDEVNGRLLTAFNGFSAADWAGPHTAVSAEAFAANPLRNRLSVLIARTTHIDYHLGQAVLAKK